MITRRSLLRSTSALALASGLASLIPRTISALADDVIPVSTLATGSYAANAFAGFTTPASVIAARGGQNYMSSNPDNGIILASTQKSWRDMEVSTWTARGCIYLRMANGSALVFYNVASINTIRIGTVENFVPGTGSSNDFGGSGNFYWAYQNQNCTGTLAGYSTTYSPNAVFTFGCKGFTIYLKINGVAVVSYTDWRLCQAGLGQVWTHQSFPATDVMVHYLPLESLYSMPSSNIYDIRDFGARALDSVTGSISAGSNQLVLASNPGFQVGDQIIVETGGEPGGGLRGTAGVGGTCPSLSYATVSAMNADRTQANGTNAWVVANGLVYSYSTGTSTWTAGVAQANTLSYYPIQAAPLALVATITGISGDTLALSANSVAATTNANVWLDCLPSFLPLTQNLIPIVDGGGGLGQFSPNPNNMQITVPAGKWRMSGPASPGSASAVTSGLQIYGRGISSTTLTSPMGCTCAVFQIGEIAVNNVSVHDMAYVGNFNNAGGFGLQYSGSNNQFSTFPSAFSLVSPGATSTGLSLYNLAGTNSFGQLCGITGSAPKISNCTLSIQYGQHDYVGWQFQLADSANGQIENCTLTGAYTVKSFEVFACNTCSIINCGGQNTIFSTNSSTDTTIDLTQNVTFKAGCWFNANATGVDEPIFNINSNAFGGGGGGTMICRAGFQCIQQSYIDGNYNSLKFIQIQSTQTGWTIEGGFDGGGGCSELLGGFFQAPDYNPLSVEYGAMLIYSDASRTAVRGIRIVGAAIGLPGHSGHYGNISLCGASSSVADCVADAIQMGPTESDNQINTKLRRRKVGACQRAAEKALQRHL